MEGIYQHFREEEYPFIDQILEITMQVTDEYTPKLTDFLDPRQRFIVQTIIGGYDNIEVAFSGGTPFTERKRALIYPDYYTPEDEDFNLTLFHIRYPVKFTTLSHQKILGTLMSLGIKRDIFGDIVNLGDEWQFFADAEMENYILNQLDKIGKVNIMLEKWPLDEALQVEQVWTGEMITASSLRLDSIIANALHLSRQKVKQMIQAKLVKVNWKVVENPDFECEEEDILSVRGYGRMKLMQIHGRTKKDKIRMDIGFLK
ncbi:YlmH family RNA-binding protein [Listeria fleischmannii]|jgi:RNA-binding protein YlmH|uniref:RNA-binding S4 domain-containing protein n=3 Tax=Listeria fleischmannii TaxID=1069827 RepID=W7DSN7_9LIST|nr:RNA-binding protein [Listeria fleischmannii]EUJ65337.1 RNA-binding S4 domain-containing protein [Listeria fleischmannii FSL S10-1203]MBC1398273.1 RNA-binding protein [Listeria fleischmannii]MBC1418602.1 RNA-binding protein [Listeria fleischmannii]MBC1426334.1 RNA-binding protein [Listeria fleischmannii]STY35601.1 photosystem II S4 domain protein [Listeria fleischmannii subsp. coloradonensis]